MAGSLNKVFIIGNLGRDPELAYTKNGTPICTLNIATNEKWKDAQGNWQEKAEWHRVIVWNNMGEACANYLRKGSSVYVEGSLQTRKWQDQNGQDRWTTEIVARNVQFLDGRQQDGQSDRGQSPYQEQQGYGNQSGQQSQGQGRQRPQQGALPADDLGPAFPSEASGMDDVPF